MKSKKIKVDVKHLAKLTGIKIKKNEERKLAQELAQTIDYFAILKKLNTEKLPPLTHPLKLKNVFFNDQTKKPLTTKEIFQNTKNNMGRFFTTNRINWE